MSDRPLTVRPPQEVRTQRIEKHLGNAFVAVEAKRTRLFANDGTHSDHTSFTVDLATLVEDRRTDTRPKFNRDQLREAKDVLQFVVSNVLTDDEVPQVADGDHELPPRVKDMLRQAYGQGLAYGHGEAAPGIYDTDRAMTLDQVIARFEGRE